MLTSTYWWNKPSIGVALTDGVGEIELAVLVQVNISPTPHPRCVMP
jgi:hypothetical protein